MIKKRGPALTISVSILMFLAPLVSCTPSNVNPNSANKFTKSISHNGLKRTYRLYIPSSYNASVSTSLVVALHGGGGNGQKMEKLSRFNLQANQNRFIVVYPNAVARHWNDGRDVNKYRSHRDNIDDVGFISRVIDAVTDDYNINRQRIYVTGASNGAMMSMRLACELTDKITAIAPVIGSMPKNLVSGCTPKRPIPVLMINGKSDPLVPWEGEHVRFGRRKLGKILSVPDTVGFWVSHNGCSPKPQISWEPDTDPQDGTRIRKTVYAQCEDGVEVILYEIQGGGHTWPGGYQYLPEFIIGRTSRDIDGTEIIWEFFEKYSKWDPGSFESVSALCKKVRNEKDHYGLSIVPFFIGIYRLC